LDRIRHYLSDSSNSEVIVVDDGSTDQMAQVVGQAAEDWPALRLLVNDRNRGKGFSVRRGVLQARGRYVLLTDSDLSAPIDQADVLITALETTGADAVVGSRALRRDLIGVHQPLLRQLGGIFFNWTVRLSTGLKLRDTQCGFKLFRRETTQWAFEQMRAERFGFDPELLFLIRKAGGRVVEMPVRWDNDPATRFSVLRDTFQSFREVLAIRWRDWLGQYPAPRRACKDTDSQASAHD
jgi:glycosyltransferase involved in cell wall biosynthesis